MKRAGVIKRAGHQLGRPIATIPGNWDNMWDKIPWLTHPTLESGRCCNERCFYVSVSAWRVLNNLDLLGLWVSLWGGRSTVVGWEAQHSRACLCLAVLKMSKLVRKHPSFRKGLPISALFEEKSYSLEEVTMGHKCSTPTRTDGLMQTVASLFIYYLLSELAKMDGNIVIIIIR